jgi:hypothetical protein
MRFGFFSCFARAMFSRDVIEPNHLIGRHLQCPSEVMERERIRIVRGILGIRRPASNGSAVSNPAAGTTCRSGHPRMVC